MGGGGEWQYGEVMAFIIIGTIILLTSLLVLLIFLNVLLSKKHREIERRLLGQNSNNPGNSYTDGNQTDKPNEAERSRRGKSESSESEAVETPTPTTSDVKPVDPQKTVFNYRTLSEKERCASETGVRLAEVKVDIENMMASNNIELAQQPSDNIVDNQNRGSPKKSRSPLKKGEAKNTIPTANQNRENSNDGISSASIEDSDQKSGKAIEEPIPNINLTKRGSDNSLDYGTFSDHSSTPCELASRSYSRSVRFCDTEYPNEINQIPPPSPPVSGQSPQGDALQDTKVADPKQQTENVPMQRKVDYF